MNVRWVVLVLGVVASVVPSLRSLAQQPALALDEN
jgi:hypothetical protein